MLTGKLRNIWFKYRLNLIILTQTSSLILKLRMVMFSRKCLTFCYLILEMGDTSSNRYSIISLGMMQLIPNFDNELPFTSTLIMFSLYYSTGVLPPSGNTNISSVRRSKFSTGSTLEYHKPIRP